MTNYENTALYAGFTDNIIRRTNEHKEGRNKNCFTAKYKLTKLVYYETFSYVYNAIAREKQIKAGSRQKKIDLINSLNPEWKDLYDELF
jgi:putative endonuclease